MSSPAPDTDYESLAKLFGIKLPSESHATFKNPYDPLIEDAAARHGVDPDLIRAQMRQESTFKRGATSPKGASGLMQLMPDTARAMGVKDIYDPQQNIEGGTKYLKQQLDKFGSVPLALAAYNAGPGAVAKYGNKIPPYKETRDYVSKITSRYQGDGLHPNQKTDFDALDKHFFGDGKPEEPTTNYNALEQVFGLSDRPVSPESGKPMALPSDVPQTPVTPTVPQGTMLQTPTAPVTGGMAAVGNFPAVDTMELLGKPAGGVMPVDGQPIPVQPKKVLPQAVQPMVPQGHTSAGAVSAEDYPNPVAPQTPVVAETADNAPGAVVEVPVNITDKQKASDYVLKELQTRYPGADFSKQGLLADYEPGYPVGITKADLESALKAGGGTSNAEDMSAQRKAEAIAPPSDEALRQKAIDELTNEKRAEGLNRFDRDAPESSKQNLALTEDEIQKRIDEYKAQELSPEAKSRAYDVAQKNSDVTGGSFLSGLYAGAGSAIHTAAGVLRPFSALGVPGYSSLSHLGKEMQAVSGYRNEGKGAKDAGESIGGFIGESIPSLGEMFVIPGGPVAKFAFLGGAKAAGAGASASDIGKGTVEGALTGKAFQIAEGLKNPLARLGTVFGGSMVANTAVGVPLDQSFHKALMNTAFQGVNDGLMKAGEMYRFWKDGKAADVQIDDKGEVLLQPTDPKREVAGEIVLDPKNEIYQKKAEYKGSTEQSIKPIDDSISPTPKSETQPAASLTSETQTESAPEKGVIAVNLATGERQNLSMDVMKDYMRQEWLKHEYGDKVGQQMYEEELRTGRVVQPTEKNITPKGEAPKQLAGESAPPEAAPQQREEALREPKVDAKAMDDIRSPSATAIRNASDGTYNGATQTKNELVPIDDLIGGTQNQQGENTRVDKLAADLQKPDAYFERIIVDGDNNVIEGQHRLEALRKLGVKDVPVVRVTETKQSIPNVEDVEQKFAKAVQLHREHRQQLIDNAAEIVAKDGVKGLREYEAPKGYEEPWQKLVDIIDPEPPRVEGKTAGVGKGEMPDEIFSRDELRISKPSKSARKRPNGTDGEVTVKVDAPFKVTDPSNWSRLDDSDKLGATVSARLDFKTGKPPSKTDAVWNVYNKQNKLLDQNLSYADALEKAKDHVYSANPQAPAENPPSNTPSETAAAKASETAASKASDSKSGGGNERELDKPQGEVKVSKSISQKSVDEGREPLKIAKYDIKTDKGQIAAVNDLVQNHPAMMHNIIRGSEELPKEITIGHFIKGVEDHIDTLPEGEAKDNLREALANSEPVLRSSETAQHLRSLQMRDPDSVTALAQEVRRARIANAEGTKGGAAYEEQLKQAKTKLADVEKQLAEKGQSANQTDLDNKAYIKTLFEKVKAEGGQKKFGDTFNDLVAQARKNQDAKKGQFSSGFTPQDVIDWGLIAADHLVKGIKAGAELAEAIKKNVEDIFGEKGEKFFEERIRPNLDKIETKAKEFYEAHSEVKGKSNKKLTPDEIIAKSEAGVTPLDKNLVGSLVMGHLRNGVEPKDVMFAVTKDVQKLYPEADERQIKELFTDYGKTEAPNSSDLTKQRAEVKRIATLTLALEDVNTGKRPWKPDHAGQTKSEYVQAREAELDKAMQDAGIPKVPVEQRQSIREKALQKQLEALQAGQKRVKGTGVPDTAKITALKEAIAAEKAKTADADRLTARKKAINTATRKINEKIASGDYSKPERSAPPTDPEVKRLEEERALAQQHLANLRDVGKVTPEEIKQLADLTDKVKETKKGLFDKDGNPINQREGVNGKSTPEEIEYGLAQNDLDEYVATLKNKATNDPFLLKAIKTVFELQRKLITFGHGGVIPFTHARTSAFVPTETRIFTDTVGRAYSYLTPNAGSARHRIDMAKLRSHPNFDFWKKSGLEVSPQSKPVGMGMSRWTDQSFDALKTMRINLAEKYWHTFPKDMQTPEMAKDLATRINHATGTLKTPQEVSNVLSWAMFAPKLRFAKYASVTDAFTSQFATKRLAKVLATNIGLLAVNSLVNNYIVGTQGNDNVNFTDPTKADWLRLKIAGMTLPLSPTFEVARLPFRIGAVMLDPKENDKFKVIRTEIASAAHPTLTTAYGLLTGKDEWTGKSLPFRGVSQYVYGDKRSQDAEKQMGKMEYGANFLPIPFQPVIKDMSQNGVHLDTHLAPAIVESLLSGLMGEHSYPNVPYGEKKKKSLGSNEKFDEDKVSPEARAAQLKHSKFSKVMEDLEKVQKMGGDDKALKDELEGKLARTSVPLTQAEADKANKLLGVDTYQAETDEEEHAKPNFNKYNKTVSGFLDVAAAWLKGASNDPADAWDKFIHEGPSHIKRLENGAIIVQRQDEYDPGFSERERKRLGGGGKAVKLEHMLPLELGGTNATSNLKLVTTEEHDRYTPMENYLAGALHDNKIDKAKAKELILSFKKGWIGEQDIIKQVGEPFEGTADTTPTRPARKAAPKAMPGFRKFKL